MTFPDLNTITLKRGAHRTRTDGVCIVELAAWAKGIEHTDRIECCSQVVQAFLRQWNDDLDDEGRQRLKPYALKLLDTTPDPETEEVRAWLVTDWLVRTCAPAWLELAGVEESPAALRALPPVTARTVKAAQPAISTARDRGAAARAAARDAAVAAAGDAARDAAVAAAGDAAVAAARDATRAAARDATRAAARDAAVAAARDAAWAKLEPTKVTLQASVFELLDRMIELEPKVAA